MYSIGEIVEYRHFLYDDIETVRTGTIEEVNSDMDSYIDIISDNDVVKYYSKKLRKYVPVKKKNIDSIYFTIPQREGYDFVLIKDIVRSITLGRQETNK